MTGTAAGTVSTVRDARRIRRANPSRTADRAAQAAGDALRSMLADPAVAAALRIHLERIRGG